MFDVVLRRGFVDSTTTQIEQLQQFGVVLQLLQARSESNHGRMNQHRFIPEYSHARLMPGSCHFVVEACGTCGLRARSSKCLMLVCPLCLLASHPDCLGEAKRLWPAHCLDEAIQANWVGERQSGLTLEQALQCVLNFNLQEELSVSHVACVWQYR